MTTKTLNPYEIEIFPTGNTGKKGFSTWCARMRDDHECAAYKNFTTTAISACIDMIKANHGASDNTSKYTCFQGSSIHTIPKEGRPLDHVIMNCHAMGG